MNRTLIKIFLSLIFLLSVNSIFGINAAVKTVAMRGRYFSKEQENAYYVKLVREIVPARFQKELIAHTIDFPIEYKLLLLSQADVESYHWTVMKSKPNNNGTIDLGPLGLNSNNIKDPWFRLKYWPTELEEAKADKNVIYMVACINFFTDLLNQFKTVEEVLIAYNAGPSTAKNKVRPPARTRLYISWVSESLNVIVNRFDDIAISEMLTALKKSVEEKNANKTSFGDSVGKIDRIIFPQSSSLVFGDLIHPADIRRRIVSIEIPWTITRTWVEVFMSESGMEMIDNEKSGYDTVLIYV
jgi:hypothetical protein